MTVNLINTSNVTDDLSLELGGPVALTTTVVGGTTFLIVGGGDDSGVSVFRVGSDGSLTNTANVDGLIAVSSLATATIAGQTILYVSGYGSGSITLFDVSASGVLTQINTPTPVDHPTSIVTIALGDNTYTYVAGSVLDTVTGFVRTPGGSLVQLGSGTPDNATLELDGVSSLAAAVVGGVHYLFATGRQDDGISVFKIGEDGSLTNTFNVTDNATLKLDGALGVSAAVVGTKTFLFAAGVDDNGVSVFEVGANGSLSNVANVGDDATLKLGTAVGLTTAVVDGSTFLFVAGQSDDGVSAFSVGANGSLTNVGNIGDGGPLELDGAVAVKTAVVGGIPLLFAAGYFDSGVSTFRIDNKSGNQTYFVGNPHQIVDETGGGGDDTVVSSISFDLSDPLHVKGSVENLTLTGLLALTAVGNFLHNVLIGNGGGNILDGRGGGDILRGLAGSDTYIVDNVGDVVDESVAGSNGSDTVRSSVNFSLADIARAKGAIENLTLIGSGDINGIGNSLANLIVGNAGRNNLHGGLGNDNLDGGAGNDALDGDGGVDKMRGQAGSDIYSVDNLADVVDESVAGSDGTDTVQSSVNFSLADIARAKGAIEDLTLTGSSDINGIGNSLANLIIGNAGRNSLHGGLGNDNLDGGAGNDALDGDGGADKMRGQAGSDIYSVDNLADVVDESVAGSDGIDTVRSSVNFSLADIARAKGAIEDLTLTGSGDINGIGNSLANLIVGNAADNTLSGGLGKDTLAGAAGKDSYLFNTALSKSNVDTIVGFSLKDDTIELDNAIFTKLHKEGQLKSTNLEISKRADDKNDYFLLDKKTGTLYYDPDGSGHAAKERVAQMKDLIKEQLDLLHHLNDHMLIV